MKRKTNTIYLKSLRSVFIAKEERVRYRQQGSLAM